MALRFTSRQIIQRSESNAEQRFDPIALATADFNRDGALDIVTNGFDLFLGKGNGSFSPAALPADLQQLAFNRPAAADLNRDGNPDLISLGSEIQTWLGNGRGGFTAAQSIPVGPVSTTVITDLNGDRNPDVVVINAGRRDQPATQSVSILLGTGTGFRAPQPLAVKGRPLDAAAGDFNGDGKRDLVLLNTVSNSGRLKGNRSTQQLTLLLGRGNGTFRTADSTPIKANQFSQLVAGDFNRDGRADLAVGSRQTITVLLGSPQGLKQHRRFSTQPNEVENLTIGDFTGDGKPDLIITESDVGYTGFRVMQGDGRGNFDPPSGSFGTSVDYDRSDELNAYSAIKGDFNGDGKLDLATADGASYTSGTVTVFLNTTPKQASSRSARQSRTRVDRLTGLEAPIESAPQPFPSRKSRQGLPASPDLPGLTSTTLKGFGSQPIVTDAIATDAIATAAIEPIDCSSSSTGLPSTSHLPLDSWLSSGLAGLAGLAPTYGQFGSTRGSWEFQRAAGWS